MDSQKKHSVLFRLITKRWECKIKQDKKLKSVRKRCVPYEMNALPKDFKRNNKWQCECETEKNLNWWEMEEVGQRVVEPEFYSLLMQISSKTVGINGGILWDENNNIS